ncbi:hypothetical protein [Lysinibacillus sp. NPDC056185]|uniref:hypothetical protein n=1 Tax=Lysinibacillus sp. NPDC056185 TaxID=3345739 RepID=UPI0039F12E26
MKAGILWQKNCHKGALWVNRSQNKLNRAVKVVKTTVKEAAKDYKSLDKMEPLKINKDMSTKEKMVMGGIQ